MLGSFQGFLWKHRAYIIVSSAICGLFNTAYVGLNFLFNCFLTPIEPNTTIRMVEFYFAVFQIFVILAGFWLVYENILKRKNNIHRYNPVDNGFEEET